MLKSSKYSCQNIYDNINDNKYNSNNSSKELLEELCDLKAMLEMQAIINQEQEEALKKINEEKNNIINENNVCTSKLSISKISVL